MISLLTTDELARILWDYNNLNHTLKKSDCILVLGSNDTRVAERGAELFLQGMAPLIIFSGKSGRLTKDLWSKTEAEVFAEVALKMGVPKDKILLEVQATNTGENILFTKRLLDEKNIAIHSVILVQKPYMQRRAWATFKKVWPEKEVVVTASQISFTDYPNSEISKEILINVLVGDTQRVMLYPQKGYQIPQKMPRKVKEAYQELIERGYTRWLII